MGKRNRQYEAKKEGVNGRNWLTTNVGTYVIVGRISEEHGTESDGWCS